MSGHTPWGDIKHKGVGRSKGNDMSVEDEVDALLGEFNAGDGAEVGTTVVLGHDRHGRAIRVGSLVSVGDEAREGGFLLGWARRIESNEDEDKPGWMEIARFDGEEGGGQNGQWVVVDPELADTEVIERGDMVTVALDGDKDVYGTVVCEVPKDDGKHTALDIQLMVWERADDRERGRVRPHMMGRTDHAYAIDRFTNTDAYWTVWELEHAQVPYLNTMRRALPERDPSQL